MIQMIRDARTIVKSRWSLWKIGRAYSKLRKEYRADGRTMDIHKLEHDERWESELHEDEIDNVRSSRLLRKQARLDIPVEWFQEESPLWMRSQQLGYAMLTTKGRHEARKAIREERFARWQDWRLVGPVFGALGFATGQAVALWPDLFRHAVAWIMMKTG